MRVTVTEHVLPLLAPLETSQGAVARRVVWVVALEDDAGRIGLGEAAPLPQFGGEDPPTCQEALAQALPLLTESFVMNWIERARPDAALGRLEHLLQKAPCARNAIEGALIDLLAQRQEIPVAELLAGGPSLTSIPVNALVGGSLTDIADQVQARLAEGYRTFKLKVGGDIFGDAKRLRALREWAGPDAHLRVDANGAWDRQQAQFFLEASRDLKLEYAEQLVAADDLDGMVQLRRATGIMLAADEAVRSPADVARIAAAQAAQIIVLKPMFLGGWRLTKQATELARSQGIEVVLTSAIDGCVGRAHATHIAAALGLNQRAQGLATGDLLAADLTATPLIPSNGMITISEAPGLGVGGPTAATQR